MRRKAKKYWKSYNNRIKKICFQNMRLTMNFKENLKNLIAYLRRS